MLALCKTFPCEIGCRGRVWSSFWNALRPLRDEEASLADISVSAQLPDPADRPPAEGVNFFHFSFVGTDVQLLTGYVDAYAVHKARERARSGENDGRPSVQINVTHRFLMSPMGLARLKEGLDDIWEKLEAQRSEAAGEQDDLEEE